MPHRKPIVGGNWKMNTDLASARALAGAVVVEAMRDRLCEVCDIVLFPPFPYITTVGSVIRGTGVALGAQNVYHEKSGAYTGEVSTAMLRDIDVTHVIMGHSERRHVIRPGEGDDLINAKVRAVVDAAMTAVLCIGETLAEREAGRTEEITHRQLAFGLDGVNADDLSEGRVVIAYEPVWAIGTGRTASPEDAQAVQARLRQSLRDRYNGTVAEQVRIQYGGSVKADNACPLAERHDIDGFLVGGASLNGAEFLEIVRAAAARK